MDSKQREDYLDKLDEMTWVQSKRRLKCHSFKNSLLSGVAYDGLCLFWLAAIGVWLWQGYQWLDSAILPAVSPLTVLGPASSTKMQGLNLVIDWLWKVNLGVYFAIFGFIWSSMCEEPIRSAEQRQKVVLEIMDDKKERAAGR